MGFKKTLLAGITALALSMPGLANSALTFSFDWGATTEGGLIPLSGPVNELKFTAESVIVFDGAPFTAGTTFTDYIVLRVDQLFFGGNLALTPYGPLFGMEITVLAELTGTQIDATNYVVTGINSFELIYDGPNGGFTSADFANLATFTDGQQTETASFVDGTGTNSTLAPDGVLDLFIGLLDLIVEGDFEVQVNGDSFGSHLLGITNSNNALCGGLQTCFADPSLILALFGADANVFFHTRSDGSIEKLAVPEPATLGLFGLALVIMGLVANRRRRSYTA
jgi:hypothetical protein